MNDDYVHHHSIEKDSDNHLWVPVHFYPYKIEQVSMMVLDKFLQMVKFYLRSRLPKFSLTMG